jgi:hypothetical protein
MATAAKWQIDNSLPEYQSHIRIEHMLCNDNETDKTQ